MIKKHIVLLLLVICLISNTMQFAYAGWTIENGERVLTPDSYTEDGKIKVYCYFQIQYPDAHLVMELPKIEQALIYPEFVGADNRFVNGILTYTNLDKITPGFFNIEWIFTPDDDKYAKTTGYFKYEVFPADDEKSKGKIDAEEDISEKEKFSPILATTKITLDSKTSYDININNKVTGSKYVWTSSNPKVAKVNKKSGVVTAVSKGTAIITCEMTLPDNTTQILSSKVIVGIDDDTPTLSKANLNLKVNKKYNLKLKNEIDKSKYKWASSDTSVVKVNSSGKITAIGEGTAYVTCTITTPKNEVFVLKCNVNVTK